MQDFGAKNKLYSYYFSFWSKRLLFAGYCELNYFFFDLLAYVIKKQ